MKCPSVRAVAVSIALLASVPGTGAEVEESSPAQDAAKTEVIVVTGTKLPERLEFVPETVTVVTGEELRARGVVDLRTALSLTAGVNVSPGSDVGPAGSVPALWGLSEFDAFLLVVDDVPYGGAFNPALATLDLTDVERIEVLRGAAPVSYGATSFVGVIHVIHHAAGTSPTRLSASAGNRDTGLGSGTVSLPELGPVKQSLTANGETRKFTQDDSEVDRFHALYRGSVDLDTVHAHLDLDYTLLRQEPYSPQPREGTQLSPRFILDANANPSNAKADQDRIQLNAGVTQTFAAFGGIDWTTLYSAAYTDYENIRGFLRDDFATDGVTHNADGFAQNIYTTDMYADTYLTTKPLEDVRWVVGADWLYGNGRQGSHNFEYAVLPDGSNRPSSGSLPVDEITEAKDRRNFVGGYTQVDWQPGERWDLTAGIRVNAIFEERHGSVFPSDPAESIESNSDSRNEVRPSGMFGGSYAFWVSDPDRAAVFMNYRNTFKPAAIDFGPEGEGQILKPEDAQSWEAGFRGRVLEGRIDWEVAYFHMNFENLVIAENIDGLPGKANAGQEEFQGVELEGDYRIIDDLMLTANYAYHSAKFTDFLRVQPDGSLQQLRGNDLELSPEHLGGAGILYAPKLGPQLSVGWRFVGSRYLDKSNTARVDAFNLVDAGVGYRFEFYGDSKVTWRINGYNLTNARDPVSESELGDSQFYRMPGTTVLGSIDVDL